MSAPPSLIAVLAAENDRKLLHAIAAREGWKVTVVDDVTALPAAISARAPGVILYDRDTPGMLWRHAVQSLAQSAPDCSILLVSSVSDRYLWEEVVRLGGYDVLTKPLSADALIHAVHLAWTYYRAGVAAKSARATK